MEIEIKAIIKIDAAYGNLTDKEEKDWFLSLLNDKKNILLILHSNDVGDEIGSTNDFKYKLKPKEDV